MPRVIWDESFSVDVAEIDKQHKRWIEIINELHETLLGGEGVRDVTIKTLRDMIDYVGYHFAFEEEYMQKNSFVDYPAHKAMHDDFVARIDKLYQDEMAGEMVLNTQVMKMLVSWLQNHILSEDKKYSPPNA